MQKISFKDRFGLTDLVLSGQKTQTRRIVPKEIFTLDWDIRENYENGTLELVIADSFGDYHNVINTVYNKYKNNEVVAVSQSYEKAKVEFVPFKKGCKKWGDARKLAGWTNKMFVRAELMPHAIKITNIRVERLQDISDEDCMREGIRDYEDYVFFENFSSRGYNNVCYYSFLRDAFADLINRISGKGTWESNPYVWAYDFELAK